MTRPATRRRSLPRPLAVLAAVSLLVAACSSVAPDGLGDGSAGRVAPPTEAAGADGGTDAEPGTGGTDVSDAELVDALAGDVVDYCTSTAVSSGVGAAPSGEASGGGEATAGPVSPASARPSIVEPVLAGQAQLGPAIASASLSPVQAGPGLEDRALPTNQWWTSALVGPGSGYLWAMPLTVGAIADQGIELRVPPVLATPDAIVSEWHPPLMVTGATGATRVLDHDDFSVLLEVDQTDADPVRMRVAQGRPAIDVTFPAGPIEVEVFRNPPLDCRLGDDAVQVTSADGRPWAIISSVPLEWSEAGTAIAATSDGPARVTFVPHPDAVAEDWLPIARALAAAPIGGTSSDLAVDWPAGVVRQTLRWGDGAAEGASAVLPHHWVLLDDPPPVIATFDSPRGPIRVVAGGEHRYELPIAGLLPGVPALPAGAVDGGLAGELRAAVENEPVGELGAGSYFGSKDLARLATLVETGRRLGADIPSLETALADAVRGAVDYDDSGDTRWLAYDDVWGGLVAQPVEFGSEDFNDHHFHYGYLIHAAAVVAEGDPDLVDDYGAAVDLLVADIIGDADDPAFPERRVFNPYLGHSYASGFSPFDDGNNQESSSEAANAWWASVRWALVSGNDELLDRATAHYVLETHTARAYWLDELGVGRADGYEHRAAGIVWGGKVDFATWFDPRPAAVVGIQLLPVNFGSIYRSDPEAAASRFAVGESDPIWPDVALMDLALADPVRARAGLDEGVEIEDGNTAAFARYWIEYLATHGPPRGDVRVDGPYGATFGRHGGDLWLVAVNPTSDPIEVGFHDDSGEIGRLSVPAGGSVAERVAGR